MTANAIWILIGTLQNERGILYGSYECSKCRFEFKDYRNEIDNVKICPNCNAHINRQKVRAI